MKHMTVKDIPSLLTVEGKNDFFKRLASDEPFETLGVFPLAFEFFFTFFFSFPSNFLSSEKGRRESRKILVCMF